MRGTTPTHIFNVSVPSDLIAKARVTYAYEDQILVVKNTADLIIGDNTITAQLSRDDTLTFPNDGTVEFQLEVETTDGASLKTPVFRKRSTILLNSEALE